MHCSDSHSCRGPFTKLTGELPSRFSGADFPFGDTLATSIFLPPEQACICVHVEVTAWENRLYEWFSPEKVKKKITGNLVLSV